MAPEHGNARFETKQLPGERDVVAPDGCDVRILLGVRGGALAHFELAPNETSVAVVHRTVEEIWFFLRGRGEMWRRLGADEEVVALVPDVCLTIPLGTEFQFRSFGPEPLSALGATIPPWPGSGEASVVGGPWTATVEPGPT
jgi:mannose-6-phosphate isomerase-like protein (cupin superfamily)